MSNFLKPIIIGATSVCSIFVNTSAFSADNTLAEAFSNGKPFVNLRLRYESADQSDNGLDTADALTLRTAFGYESGDFDGFSFLLEAEDVREVFGVRDFTAPFNRVTEFDVIADPETTELNQAYIKYKSGNFTSKLGRQIIALDGHRFIGSVAWRQDWQTFDGISANYKDDKFEITGAYITQRNRIFAEEADIDSEDVFLNASYKFGSGKLVAYAYLLEVDDVPDTSLDTYGLSYTGSVKFGETKVDYKAEYATQDNDASGADTDYFNIGAGAKFGPIKLSAAYEILGSDDGAGAFATPLATLHKFNGWADVFLRTPAIGLEDLKLTLDADIAGGKFKLAYHDFSGDESVAGGGDDLGDEIDVQYTRNFGKHIYTGIKYANYSAGSAIENVGLIRDTERFWAWVGFKFK